MSSNNGDINQAALWGDFTEEEKARVKDRRILANKMRHKALNIPYSDDEEMNVDSRTTINGIGTKGLIGVALAAGLAPALAIWGLSGMPGLPKAAAPVPVMTQPAANQPVATAPAVQQLDSEWDVETYLVDEKGNPIQPEKIIGRTRYRSRSGLVEIKQPDGTWKPAPSVKAP